MQTTKLAQVIIALYCLINAQSTSKMGRDHISDRTYTFYAYQSVFILLLFVIKTCDIEIFRHSRVI